MEDTIFNRIIEFVEEFWFKFDFPLTRKTDIKNDLKIRGDDAVDFFLAYSKRFNVDLTNFMADNYIEDEGMNLIFKENKKKLTLGDLEKGIIAGKLDEDVINN